MMRARHLILVCALSFGVVTGAALGAPSKPEPATVLAVGWSPESPWPSTVSLDDSSDNIRLTLDTQRRRFQGRYKYRVSGSGELVKATLSALFPDEFVLWVPLKIHEGLEVVSTTFYRPRVTTCTMSAMGRIDERSASVEETLRRFFTAQVALGLTGSNKCGPKMKARVKKAWCDRWFDLAGQKTFYDVDEARTNECGKVLSKRDLERRLLRVRHARLLFQLDWRNDEFARGNEALARAINESLIERLQNDRALGDFAKARDGLTVERFRQEFATEEAPNGPMVHLETPPGAVADPFAFVYGNTVVLTDRAGNESLMWIKQDGTYRFRSSAGNLGTGTWVLKDNNTQYCAVPDVPFQTDNAPETCSILTRPITLGEKVDLLVGANRKVTIELRTGVQ